MGLGIKLVKIAAVYLFVGAVMGLVMGIASDFSLSSVHAHISLLGWATMAIAGLVYIQIPACGRTRLAAVHFWTHNIGLPVMTLSLALETYGIKAAEKAVATGSMIVLAALAMFVLNLFLNGRERADTRRQSVGPRSNDRLLAS